VSEQPHDSDVVQILRAIEANTAALTKLAYAVMQMVNVMADTEDDGHVPETYIDGTPID
jgi:hypothetical protein